MATGFSCEILQIDTQTQVEAKTMGFSSANVGNIWATKDTDGHPVDAKPAASIYRLVDAGFEYGDTLSGKKIYYTSDTVAQLMTKINT